MQPPKFGTQNTGTDSFDGYALSPKAMLPPLALFQNEKTLTGHEYKFFNKMLGPAKQDSNEPPNTLVKSMLQNKAITLGNVAEFKRIEVEDVENLNLEDDDTFWEDLGV